MLLDEDRQVVVVELVGPARVLAVLGADHLGEQDADARLRARPRVGLARQRPNRVRRVVAREVVPALEGLDAEAHGLAGRRVLVGPGCELGERRPEVAVLGRARQQRADHREAEASPARTGALVAAHRAHLLLALEGADLAPLEGRPPYALGDAIPSTVLCVAGLLPQIS